MAVTSFRKKNFTGLLRLIFFIFVGVAILYALITVFTPSLSRVGERIVVEIAAPQKVEAASRVRFEVRIANASGLDLEDVEIVFQYPSGARAVFNTDPKTQERRRIGVFANRQEIQEVFETRLFDAGAASEPGKVILEYRTKRSNAILIKEKSLPSVVVRSPLSLHIIAPDEVRLNQEVALEIGLLSQADVRLENVAVRIEYPVGFEYTGADVSPIKDKAVWEFSFLEPGKENVFTVRGTLSGFEGEQKAFIVTTGLMDPQSGTFNPYTQEVKVIALSRPLVELEVKTRSDKRNSKGAFVVSAGETVFLELVFKNNLSAALENVIARVSLKGDIVDRKSVSVENGFFDFGNSEAVWNVGSDSSLARIDPGEDGRLTFSFRVKSDNTMIGSSISNSLLVRASLAPEKTPREFEGVDITGRAEFEAFLATSLQLAAKALYNYELLPGSGPLPPRVGQETMYTVVWSLVNTVNDAEGVVVEAVLPAYMRWKNVMNPADSRIIFDQTQGKVVWNVGVVRGGTGIIRPSLQAAFQIGLTPDVAQVGSSPTTLLPPRVTGRDVVTDISLEDSSRQSLTTHLRDDPQTTLSDGVVRE